MDKKIIHIVEDERVVAESLRWLIESEGYTVKIYASAEDFLNQYHAKQRGCLILDVCLPGMSGLDLQELLLRRKSKLAVIFVTAHGDITMAMQAMQMGAVDFLTKPVNNHSILDVINKAMDAEVQVTAEKITEQG